MGNLLKNNKNLKNIKTLMLIVLIIIAITITIFLTNEKEFLAKISNKILMYDEYIDEDTEYIDENTGNDDEDTEYIETSSVSGFENAWKGNLDINGTMQDDYGIVESANISIGDDSLPKIADGTEPFDADDEVGNDSSNKNRIVRSFDSTTYNVDIKLKVNEEKYTDLVGKKFTGGYLYIEATLNEDNNSSWKTTEMTWLNTNGVFSKVDGKKLYVVITLDSNEEINSKIIKDLPFVVNASYTQNEKTILPTIKVWLKGNTDDEKKDVTGIEKVTVTATENYNVKIKCDTDRLWATRQKLDYDGNEIIGRMFGIGIATTLYNNNTKKGIKGTTIPSGEIEFNINIKILNDAGEDITSTVHPLIWNYSLNGYKGIISDRNMYFGKSSTDQYRFFPYGKKFYGDTIQSVYNSGTVSMQANENGNIITTKINNYEFSGDFPTKTIAKTQLSANEGYFTSMYLQIVVPETNYKGNYTIIFNEGGEDTTRVIKINGEQKAQAVSSDDTLSKYVKYEIKGNYNHLTIPLKDTGKYLVDYNYNPTHADVQKNQVFKSEFRIKSDIDWRS